MSVDVVREPIMPHFCTQCGTKIPADGAFCDHCGAALQRVGGAAGDAAHARVAVSTSGARRRPLVLAVTIVLAIGLAAGGAWWWLLGPSALNEARVRIAFDEWGGEDKLEYHCFQPTAQTERGQMQLPRIHHVGSSSPPKRLLWVPGRFAQFGQALVKSGLLKGPIRQRMSEPLPGVISEPGFDFELTAEGEKRVSQFEQFCFADDSYVEQVVAIGPVKEIGGVRVAMAVVKIGYRNPQPWASAPEAKRMIGQMEKTYEYDRYRVPLHLSKARWQVVQNREFAGEVHAAFAATELAAAKQAERPAGSRASSGAETSVASALTTLGSVFSSSGSSNPDGSEFVGKWQKINGRTTIEFIRNGASFLFIDGNDKYPATFNKDGTLQVSVPLLGTIVFAYSKGSDTVVAMGDEFKRVK